MDKIKHTTLVFSFCHLNLFSLGFWCLTLWILLEKEATPSQIFSHLVCWNFFCNENYDSLSDYFPTSFAPRHFRLTFFLLAFSLSSCDSFVPYTLYYTSIVLFWNYSLHNRLKCFFVDLTIADGSAGGVVPACKKNIFDVISPKKPFSFSTKNHFRLLIGLFFRW